MIVSTTLASKVLEVLDLVVGGGGGTKSPVGMLPASVVTEISTARATAIAKRFIFKSPFEFEDATVVVLETPKFDVLLF
jgi:hypothetical protein